MKSDVILIQKVMKESQGRVGNEERRKEERKNDDVKRLSSRRPQLPVPHQTQHLRRQWLPGTAGTLRPDRSCWTQPL